MFMEGLRRLRKEGAQSMLLKGKNDVKNVQIGLRILCCYGELDESLAMEWKQVLKFKSMD